MPGKIRVKLTPKAVFLKPSGNGNFTTGSQASAGAFRVVTSVEIALTKLNGGSMPNFIPGTPKPAKLELLARIKTNIPNAPFTLCGTIGATTGQMRLLTSGNVQLSAKKPDPHNSNLVITDFAPSSAPEIANSDFELRLFPDSSTPTSMDIDNSNPIRLHLPWVFDPRNTTFELNARLTVGGVLETDVVDLVAPNDANQAIEIQTQHLGVTDDAVINQVAQHPAFTFFGVRNLYTMSLLGSPTRIRVPFAGQTMNIFVEKSVMGLMHAPATVTTLAGFVTTIMGDLGFTSVNVDAGAAVQARFAASFKQVNTTKNNLWWMSKSVLAANEKTFADKLEADQSFSFLPTETVQIPFFDFYIVRQDVDPNGSELAHSESMSAITPPSKSILAPIVLTAGTSNLNGLRKFLSAVSDASLEAMVVATSICHEIGHTLGLRHEVEFPGAPPYKFPADAASVRGVMSGSVTPPAGTTTPFQLFGPVHRAAIQRLYF
jgi:hypothetical protein